MRRVVLVVLTSALFPCAAGENVRGLAGLADSGEWALAGISGGGKTAAIDRDELGALGDVFRDAFTLRVSRAEGEYVLSGKAAPNRFNMPVRVAEDGTLAVSPPAATLMAAFIEPSVLKEAEYLRYLANTTAVKESGGQLVLETADEAGQSVSLTFVPFGVSEL
ncbi:MAG: META domain-containing protein [Spirochaetaceae bacterium]|nr:META domain-containing protein [Spirochaetaceae bacterium]